MTETCGPSLSPTRRGVVTAAGGAGLAAVLTACGGSSSDAGSDPSSAAAAPSSDAGSTASAQPTTAAGTPTSGSSSGGDSSAGGGKPLGATADIPVGGGKIFAGEKVVVTQPTAGQFKAFSAVCTHQGCLVTSVSDGTINCPCHHSSYRIADGSVAGGPAPAPLPAKQVTVSGGQVELA